MRSSTNWQADGPGRWVPGEWLPKSQRRVWRRGPGFRRWSRVHKKNGLRFGAADGETVGTWIEPHTSRLPSRKLWIAFGQPAEGSLRVDAGAVQAIVAGGGSLLPVGITEIRGDFVEGAAVEVLDHEGSLIAKGLVTLSAMVLEPLLGKHSSAITVEGWGGEVIHRDDLVLLAGT